MAPEIKVVTVIQARSGSSRLPGKVLRPLLGKSLLIRLVERVQAAKRVGTVVVATTKLSEDSLIASVCRAARVSCYRGHATDLLDRHYRAGRLLAADAVVKIPSDVPLIDPQVIDRVLGLYLENAADTPKSPAYDYVSNLHPATYPDGNDVEVMSMAALETAWREAKRDFEREHTTPYLWENPDRFCLGNVTWETGLDYSMSHRWTIDYEQDYHLIRTVYERLYPQNPSFGLGDILALLEREPEIAALNACYAGVNWYRHHLDSLQTINRAQTRLEPAYAP